LFLICPAYGTINQLREGEQTVLSRKIRYSVFNELGIKPDKTLRGMYVDAAEEVLENMSVNEAIQIETIVSILMTNCKGLGRRSAIELVAYLGSLINSYDRD